MRFQGSRLRAWVRGLGSRSQGWAGASLGPGVEGWGCGVRADALEG
jgi:hypothetical protein